MYKKQTTYIKGRYIDSNVGFIMDIFNCCENDHTENVWMFLDIEKASHSVEWNLMSKFKTL